MVTTFHPELTGDLRCTGGSSTSSSLRAVPLNLLHAPQRVLIGSETRRATASIVMPPRE